MQGNRLSMQELKEIQDKYTNTVMLDNEESLVISKADLDDLINSTTHLILSLKDAKRRNKSLSTRLSKETNKPLKKD